MCEVRVISMRAYSYTHTRAAVLQHPAARLLVDEAASSQAVSAQRETRFYQDLIQDKDYLLCGFIYKLPL